MTSMDAQQVQRLAKRSQKETLENNFLAHWALLFGSLPAPVRQHPVRNPISGRDWRLDFAWPDSKLSVEIQGGAWSGGRHNTALGQAKDYLRHNYLVSQGWRVLYFNSANLKDVAAAVEFTAEVLCDAKEVGDG